MQPVDELARSQCRSPQADNANECVEELSLEKVVFVVKGVLGHNGACREHHDKPYGQKRHHDGEEPPVKGSCGTLGRCRNTCLCLASQLGKGTVFSLLGFAL